MMKCGFDLGTDIFSPTTSYKVQKYLGSGSFGIVTECKKVATSETVALKIFRSKKQIQTAKSEEIYLRKLKDLNADRFNIVRWNDSFTYGECYCLEFEKLDIELFTFIKSSPTQSLNLMQIRPILQQLATALDFLKSTGITHGDLKPQNIMMVQHLMSLRIKVIDFGSALSNPAKHVGATIQTLLYRSPEILLGAPFNEAIDVWSLGCISAEMFRGKLLFNVRDKYNLMKNIVDTIGKPYQKLLAAGQYAHYFFWPSYQTGSLRWLFRSLDEREDSFQPSKRMSRLEELIMICHGPSEIGGEASEHDLSYFTSLLTQMLKVDPSERITPREILEHPFITMSHLQEAYKNGPYVKSCMDMMSVCQDQSCSGKDGAKTTRQTFPNERTSTSADGISRSQKRKRPY